MTTPDKKSALEAWTGSADDQARLFFQARNLAIEAMCLRIDNHLLRAGLPVKTEWKESSFNSVSLRITLSNPKSGQSWTEVDCSILIRRLRIKSPEHLSSCFYEYQGANLSLGPRPTALMRDLASAVKALVDSEEMARLINEANYPFDYKPYSIF